MDNRLATQISQLGFTPHEIVSLVRYFTINREQINVAVSFLSVTTDDVKRDYLRSLIGMFSLNRIIFANNTEYFSYLFLCFSFLLLIVKPAQKTHLRYHRSTHFW